MNRKNKEKDGVESVHARKKRAVTENTKALVRRIFLYAQAKGWTNLILAQKMGLTPGRVTDLHTRKTQNPQVQGIAELLASSDLSETWLFFGTGPMTRDGTRSSIAQLCENCERLQQQLELIKKEYDEYRRSESQWKELLLRQSTAPKGDDQTPVGVGSDEQTNRVPHRRDEVP